METFLVVGLGNPGSRYANTRHNAGTDFVHMLCEKYDVELREKKKLSFGVLEKMCLKFYQILIFLLFLPQKMKALVLH